MRQDPLPRADDARPRPSAPIPIALADGGLTLGGFSIADAGRFDETRVAALLAAAYGERTPRGAVAYLKGALLKQRAGQAALAHTYLALAGLPPLASPIEANWRLAKADALMKSGVAPATIIEALTVGSDVARAYNPDQPRVPAGNGVVSGQWTSGDQDGATSGSQPARIDERQSAQPTTETQATLVAGNSTGWAQYLNPVSSAEAAEAARPPFNGRAPNDQHAAGVEQAMQEYASRGFLIDLPQATAVNVPGFSHQECTPLSYTIKLPTNTPE